MQVFDILLLGLYNVNCFPPSSGLVSSSELAAESILPDISRLPSVTLAVAQAVFDATGGSSGRKSTGTIDSLRYIAAPDRS